MTNTADLSVVMPTYNHAQYLPRALKALVTQSVAPAEIIVVNDASTDDTPAILEAFARDYPVVKVITNEQNRRTNESVRIGLAHARGKYLYLTASDDYVLPGFVEKMVGMLEAHPQAGLVSAYFSIVDGVTGEIRPNPSGWCAEPRYFTPAEVEKMIGHTSVPGHASIVKRSSFDAAGGLLPDLEWHSDWFLSFVVAFREGLCHVPETVSLLTDMPQSYAHGMHTERQLRVVNAILDRLTSPAYADVLPSFQRSGALSVLGLPVLRAAASRADVWTKATLGLINGFSTEQYEALLDDPHPCVAELGRFFLGPFYHETKRRRVDEENERRRLEQLVATKDRLCSQLQTAVAQRDTELAQLRQRSADTEAALMFSDQLLASRTEELREAQALAVELQETVHNMTASHFPRLRAVIDGCKKTVLKPIHRPKSAA
ncbi:MAG TPA: glycosyltransferase [Pirellulales bacterium]|nr:glycosyltransferase [Pirellulales bacterium]